MSANDVGCTEPRLVHPLQAGVTVAVVATRASFSSTRTSWASVTLFELGLRLRVADVPVRVMLPGQLAEGAFDLVRVGGLA